MATKSLPGEFPAVPDTDQIPAQSRSGQSFIIPKLASSRILLRGRPPVTDGGGIVVSHQGSSADLLLNPDGTLAAVRRMTNVDVTIAAGRRMSSSAHPNIATLFGISAASDPADDAARHALDVLSKVKGSGELYEHLWDIDAIATKYNVAINSADPGSSYGLSSNYATQCLLQFGPNILTPPPRLPLWLLFLLQFTNLLMVLLMFTGLLCFILYATNPSDPTNLYLGVLLYFTVIVTCIETFYQEAKSDALMESFRAMIPANGSVVRDAQLQSIPVMQLVPGDLIFLNCGDKVPADCRMIDVQGMKVDQSMITGESDPIRCRVIAASTNPLEAKNIVFSGSLVVEGKGYGVCIRTGDATLIGAMVGLTHVVGKAATTLQADILHFVRILITMALLQAVLVFIVGLARGLDPATIFLQGFVVIMVGNVPQGLPTTITACLFIIANRMSQCNVFVKRLDIIECLGSCTCICTDKTGTLTQNIMSVSHLWIMDKTFMNTQVLRIVEGLRHVAAFSSKSSSQLYSGAIDNISTASNNDDSFPVSLSPQLRMLLDVAILCSRVTLEVPTTSIVSHSTAPHLPLDAIQSNLPDKGDGNVAIPPTRPPSEDIDGAAIGTLGSVPVGDSTELGLYSYFQSIFELLHVSQGIEEYRAQNKMLFQIPFNSKNKWQMSIHSMQRFGGKQYLLMKGAPDVLLGKCSHFLDECGNIMPMDAIPGGFMHFFSSAYGQFADNGERVLGFAMLPLVSSIEVETIHNPRYKELLTEQLIGADSDIAMKNLIFVGLISLRDPPRDEVPEAIRECHRAGIVVVMVTGDHPRTAEAIARNIGLITLPTKRILSLSRGVPESSIPNDDPEIGAMIIRGIEVSGGSEMVNGVSVVVPPLSEQDWHHITSKKQIVFARTSPENKLTIVEEFTKVGHVTAMTGDGVNDSPAMKHAAISIAMGKNGSDVAKEAADIVLLDDNFASIVVGVREGRLLFNNLKKSIAYTLAHLVPEVFPVFLWAFFGCPQGMGTLLALCIDLLTDLAPSSALAYEIPEKLIMELPPRNVATDKLTSLPLLYYAYGQGGLILLGGCLFVYFQTFAHFGVTAFDLFSNNNKYFPSVNEHVFVTADGRRYDPEEQLYIYHVVLGSYFLMIVCGQAAHIWVCRTATMSIFTHGVFTNRYVNISFFIALGLGCFVAYTPGLQGIVNSASPLSLIMLYGSLLTAGALWCWS